jgi:hypothetical protein
MKFRPPKENTDSNGFKMLQVLKDKDHHPADEFGESLRFFLSYIPASDFHESKMTQNAMVSFLANAYILKHLASFLDIGKRIHTQGGSFAGTKLAQTLVLHIFQ